MPRTGFRKSSITASPPDVRPAPGTAVDITSHDPSGWINFLRPSRSSLLNVAKNSRTRSSFREVMCA